MFLILLKKLKIDPAIALLLCIKKHQDRMKGIHRVRRIGRIGWRGCVIFVSGDLDC